MKMFVAHVLRSVFYRIMSISSILFVRYCYYYNVQRLRKRKKDKKIKVLFLVNEVAKWKAQTLYDLMEESGLYEPEIALTFPDRYLEFTSEELIRKIKENHHFFEQKGMRVIDTIDLKCMSPILLDSFKADIVFYQQPWSVPKGQRPKDVAFTSLTCYIPYYVANYGLYAVDYALTFDKNLWRYFILSKEWERYYKRFNHFWSYAGALIGLGHTALDWLTSRQTCDDVGDYIIYAPHWSIDCAGNENEQNYATFLKNGRNILSYAKAHPNIKWVFKPHPVLMTVLEHSGVWTHEEIKTYFSEWEDIATCCYTSDYQTLFLQSRAMITDCGSFLTEYFVTGKPLIHLISSTCKVSPLPPAQKMLDSFYKVHNIEELDKTLKLVIDDGLDPMREKRLATLDSMNLRGNNAAENIIEFLAHELNIQN